MPLVSIVVPVLHEAGTLAATLAPLQVWRRHEAEIVVVDGGSSDGTAAVARPLADAVITAPRGRAAQMNAGAAAASGDVLLFLHADTRLPADALALVRQALARARWGRFDVRIEPATPLLRLVALMMNARSRLTGIATGDQGIFMTRAAFEAAGGFPAIPLMEDIAMCRALKRQGRPACLRARVATSARRWHRQGVLRTIVLMWRLRLAYALGADPQRLARLYGVERTQA